MITMKNVERIAIKQKYDSMWVKYKARYCKSCINKVYCLINNENEGNNHKAKSMVKNGKVGCMNYKPKYAKIKNAL